jgi:PAS domain S-box-containing protein
VSSDTSIHLSSDFLKQILDNVPTPIFVKDKYLKFVFLNKHYCSLTGKTELELLGRCDADLYEEDAVKAYSAIDRRVVDDGELVKVEEVNALKDGTHVPMMTRKSRVTDEHGNHFLVGTCNDLTVIKKREEQYRALSETVPVGVLQIEEDGHVAFANPLALAYLQRDVDSMTVNDVNDLLGLGQGNFPGEPSRFECTLKYADSSLRRVLVISSGWLLLNKGKTRSALVSVVDVSENAELKRINEEILRLNQELAVNMQKLKDAQDALVKKDRMEQMGQLTATVAHELRNPLGAVRTSVFLLERKLKGKGLDVDSQIQRINNGVVRCDNIITQLLDFSRSKQLICKSSELDVWLQTVIEEEGKRMPSSVQITCEFGLQDLLVPFDASRLQRAVVNLLANACEAIFGNGNTPLPKANAQPEIRISTFARHEQVFICVADNGPGIAAELLDKIREPLFTTKSFGTGLGLPAIEQIAYQHGGRLEITSKVGEGASFTLILPLVQKEEEAA